MSAAGPAGGRPRALLAVDTATLQAGVALVDETGRELASRRARVTTHSEQLLTLIAEVLAEAGHGPGDLWGAACGAGPGSFTGLRIGLATVKGLCLSSSTPLLMVSSLAALAARAPEGALVVPCIDAWKGEVYAGFYRRGASSSGEPLALLEAEAVLPPERLVAWLQARAAAEPVHLVGDGAARYPQLSEVTGVIHVDRAPPDPADVGRLAALRLLRGEADDLAAAVPSYIRPSEAELKGPPPLPPSRDPSA